MIVTVRGGHLGFLEGVLPIRKPRHWMERVVEEFVTAVRLHREQLQDKY
jgi:predicted alpha/beta-fold hydrolase